MNAQNFCQYLIYRPLPLPTRPDGTTAKYTAENADASAVMAELVKVQAQQMQMMQALMGLVSVP